MKFVLKNSHMFLLTSSLFQKLQMSYETGTENSLKLLQKNFL